MARVARTELPSSPALNGEKMGRGKEARGQGEVEDRGEMGRKATGGVGGV